MYTPLIMAVFFWSALMLLGCWIVVELSELVRKGRRDAGVRARLGFDERPGAAAWEERMRIEAAERQGAAEGAPRG